MLGELHPPVVHFAIALVITSVLFDLFGLILKKESLKNAGFWTLMAGAIAVILAFITGHQAEELVEKAIEGSQAYKRLEIHETVGTISLIMTLLLASFRILLTKITDVRLMGIYLIAGFIVMAIIGLQGRIGGKLVYEEGIGVKPVMENLLKNNKEN